MKKRIKYNNLQTLKFKKMSKFFLIMCLATLTSTMSAQKVDNFIVGPYEVEYQSEGDYKFRLRKGIDLYDYFDLEKDTIIKIEEEIPVSYKNGIQVNTFFSMPRYAMHGASNVYGVDGSWKQMIGKNVYLNAGLSVGLSWGKYSTSMNNLKDMMLEAGVPVSVEFANINEKKASLYVGGGLVPTFYSTLKAEETNASGKKQNVDKESGFMIAPRLDFGGYIPCNEQIVRIGFFGQYNINCSGTDIFKERIGRFFIGANVGLVF